LKGVLGSTKLIGRSGSKERERDLLDVISDRQPLEKI
jgi:hypothetical protein